MPGRPLLLRQLTRITTERRSSAQSLSTVASSIVNSTVMAMAAFTTVLRPCTVVARLCTRHPPLTVRLTLVVLLPSLMVGRTCITSIPIRQEQHHRSRKERKVPTPVPNPLALQGSDAHDL